MQITAEERRKLIEHAIDARKRAYAPYSNYAVGAALMTASGKIITGVNVENAAYPTSMCAERTAVFSAVAQGERAFRAIAVVTDNGGTPCGSCRQVLSEFGLDTLVTIARADGQVVLETTVAGLLPEAFGPSKLGR
ncbi:MAG: cytidine deaminase [Chloroflexi bacterium RBG_13_68_17]|nr:MAG: cytidine deaminase [Chloroflexi bacterium RBG_13_68_17]